MKIKRREAAPKYKTLNVLENLNKQFKIELENCNLCEIRCGINRFKDSGNCGLKILNEIHYRYHVTNEEDFFLPCAMIFFGRCNFNCFYCQNPHLLDIDTSRFNGSLDDEINTMVTNTMNIIKKGCSTLHFCGGEPTLNPLLLIGLLNNLKYKIPTVMNTNLYLTKQSLEMYSNIVDVWLTDFKFGNNACGKEIAGIKNYYNIIMRNHDLLINTFEQECVIRHVVLPDHLECCTKKIIKEYKEKFDQKAILNLILCFNPDRRDKNKILRRLKSEEIERTIGWINKYGVKSVMVSRSYQDMTPYKWWDYEVINEKF